MLQHLQLQLASLAGRARTKQHAHVSSSKRRSTPCCVFGQYNSSLLCGTAAGCSYSRQQMPHRQHNSCASTQAITICCTVYAVAVGVSSAYATRSLTAVQQAPDSDCNVPGFTFREGQLPHDKYFIDSSPVNIYSLPYGQTGSPKPKPFATLAATAAACQDDSACGMFTSNGYIVGANWRANDASVTKAFTKESDILKWHTMHNCSGELSPANDTQDARFS